MSSSTPKHFLSAVGRIDVPSVQSPPYSNRLPTYRSSYCGRYHPYGRRLPRNSHNIDLMKTIDTRDGDDSRNRAAITLSVVDEEDEEDIEDYEEYAETSSRTSEGDHQLAAPHPGKAVLMRRRSLTDLVVELAFAMRRNLHWKKVKPIKNP